ncbi:MAG: MoxR family ATPase [Deltaproteobacteria bacterium]|nr:MoxR family ATPase [Deltaproteobacteria bacterium]
MPSLPDVRAIQETCGIVGRAREIEDLIACLAAARHVLVEGPVGVGKTALVQAVAGSLGRPFLRVDGDGRYSEARLVGAFDPPTVMARGYVPEAFQEGPLARALEAGGVLFVNELNRMPEGVQNVLLPAMDEGRIEVPHLGTIRAAPGFAVVATQNPAEFVATGHLSEALLDRFERVRLDYQDEAEERAIVASRARLGPPPELVAAAVAMVRATRSDPHVRRGASVRAAVALADLATALGGDLDRAAALALPTRLDLLDDRDHGIDEILGSLPKKVQGGSRGPRST